MVRILSTMDHRVNLWRLTLPISIVLLWGVNVLTTGELSPDAVSKKESGTELTLDPVNSLLLVSTLDGSLTALDRTSGSVRWISRDEPMIRVPVESPSSSSKPPYFLPDPRTGSLYHLGRHRTLKKLPFTIPQLVSRAPCRSTDGVLYTGKKMDVWLTLNPFTGEKSTLLSSLEPTCPAQPNVDAESEGFNDGCPSGSRKTAKTLLIGKSEYTISMMDGIRKWNVTFNDYSSVDMSPQSIQEYDLLHFTSPSAGVILSYRRDSGKLLWQTELKTPVIAVYSIDGTTSSLVSVPFQSVASETLERLKTEQDKQLSPTLYVGECPYGLYATPSFVDETVLPISSKANQKYLIEGPASDRKDDHHHSSSQDGNVNKSTDDDPDDGDVIFLGHYEVPESPPVPVMQIESEHGISSPSREDVLPAPLNVSDFVNRTPVRSQKDSTHQTVSQPVTPNKIVFPPPPVPKEKIAFYERKPFIVLITVIMTLACTSVGYVWFRVRNGAGRGDFSNLSTPRSSDSSKGDDISYKNYSLDGSVVTIGKISFEPNAVLGKGCEGTFVFKGKFEDRDVAVKRILPECFAFADREVDLLKESDQHSNVIRYFCTESDGQFRYIALELCAATLNDWADGKFEHESILPSELLREATDGLSHLHSLNIVHRDVKPANVLLTICPIQNRVRAMISDFGLCKKLTAGRASFSRRSGGIPGTEGWIAPEVLRNLETPLERMTKSVDIFSLGCVFYYVLTKGQHPFGSPFNRQANILSGNCSVDIAESEDSEGAVNLIHLMISPDPNLRPPLSAVLSHPMFWNPDKILTFFIDVSDRIEKETEANCSVLRRLERDAVQVVRTDWRDHICEEVALDLRKYRTYKGHSVRDLLRALRNKKNHYRDLTPQAQASLGQIPDKFVQYWLKRFPLLLPHAWDKFESVKEEPIFSKYYSSEYTFCTDDLTEEDLENEPLDSNSNDTNDPTSQANKHAKDKNFWRPRSQMKNRWRKPQAGNQNFYSNTAPSLSPSSIDGQWRQSNSPSRNSPSRSPNRPYN